MKKIIMALLAIFCVVLPRFILAAPPPEKILKLQEKTIKSSTGLSVVYEPKVEEGNLDSLIFLWKIENDFGKRTQWNCYINDSTKISLKGKPVSKDTYSKWQEKELEAASAEVRFDYSFHNKKLCREILIQ